MVPAGVLSSSQSEPDEPYEEEDRRENPKEWQGKPHAAEEQNHQQQQQNNHLLVLFSPGGVLHDRTIPAVHLLRWLSHSWGSIRRFGFITLAGFGTRDVLRNGLCFRDDGGHDLRDDTTAPLTSQF